MEKDSFWLGRAFIESFNVSSHGAIIFINGKIAAINKKGMEILEIEKEEEIVGKNWIDFIHIDSMKDIEKMLKMLKEKDATSSSLKCKIIGKNGKEIEVFLFFLGARYRDREVVMIVFQDISKEKKEKKKMQEIVHNLKERLKELSCLYSIETISRKDISLDEILQEIVEIIPDSLQHAELAYSRIVLKNREYCSRKYMETKWRKATDIIINGKKEGIVEIGYLEETPPADNGPFLKEEIDLLNHVAMKIADIVEYRETREELQKSKEYFQALVRESSDIIMVIDENTVVEYISPSIKKILGFSPEEVVGKKALEFVCSEDLQIAMEKLQEIFKNPNKVVSARFRVIHKNGEWRFMDVKGRNLLEDPIVRGIVVNINDITELVEKEKALKKSEEKIRLLLNATHDFIILAAEDGTIVDLNEAMARHFGGKREELIGTNLKSFIPPDVYEKRFAKALEVKHTKKPVQFIDEQRGRWFDNRFYPIFDENGNVTQIAAFIHDITELVEKEREIEENERKLRALINATHDLVLLVKPDGTIVDLNQAMAKAMGGKSREEFIGKSIWDYKDIIPPDVFENKVKKALEVIRTKKPVRFIDKPKKWFDNRYYPIIDENGEVVQVAMFSMDITEIKEMEERFRQVAENINEWIWEVDANGLYTYSSPAVEKILGYKPEEIVGKKHFYDLFHPEDKEKLKKEAFKIFENKKPFREFLNRNLHKNGEERWLLTSGVPVIDEKGNLIGYRGLDLDITEKKKAADALIKSEEKFRILAENSPSAIFINKGRRLVYVNKKGEELTGYSRKELCSPDFDLLNLIAPEDREKIRKLFMRKQKTTSYECQLVDKKGRKRDIIVNTTEIPYENEKAILGIITDITELKKAQKEVRKLKEYLESIIENANVWLDVLDENGNVIIWNRAAEEISGYTKEEVVGHAKIWEWLYPDEEYRKKIFEKAMAIIKKGEVVEDFETVIRTKSGENKIISWFSRNLVDENGKVVGSVALGRDVTEHRKAEKMMRTLINATHDLMLLAELDGTILDLNEAMAKSLGGKREEIIGTNLRKYLPPDIFEKRTAKVREMQRTKKPVHFVDTRNGRWFDNRFYPVFDEKGEVHQVAVFTYEITEQRKMEEKLMQQEKLASLGRLAAMVAHELNTPLANIAITAEYLASKLDDEYKEELMTIKREVENASKVIRDVLNFSRMQRIEKREVDIKHIVEKAIEKVKKICATDDIIFQNRVPPYKVLGDEQRLLECFINVIKNAVMAKDEKKKSHYVIVDAVEGKDNIEIKIKDNGVGMNVKVQKEALKPFFTTRPLGEGTGLGLFIANWIVEKHGGKIEIKSKEGEGTEVSISLPKEEIE